MQSATNNNETLLTQTQAAEKLAVSIDTLSSWKNGKILTPILTLNGNDFYSAQQIEFFLKITQLVESDKINPKQSDGIQDVQAVENKPEESLTPIYPSSARKNYSTFLSSKNFVIPAGAFLGILLFVLVFAAGTTIKGNSQLSAAGKGKVLSAQATKPSNSELSSDETAQTVLTSKSLRNTETLHTQAQEQSTPSLPEGGANVATQDISTLASYVSQTTDNSNSNLVFDNNGKIKGDVTETIATTLGGIGSFNSASSSNSALANMIILFAGTLLSLALFYPKRFLLTGRNPAHIQHHTSFYPPVATEKVIEVNQKADGTIVFNLHDKEYKVSKPELYSESDQFIERLMEMTKPDIKEIDYVALNDEKIELTTPLSRLVTRLGFVGVKRDLFFPRTSKDRVFFRKYVTSQDLEDMDLTTDQILEDLNSTN